MNNVAGDAKAMVQEGTDCFKLKKQVNLTIESTLLDKIKDMIHNQQHIFRFRNSKRLVQVLK